MNTQPHLVERAIRALERQGGPVYPFALPPETLHLAAPTPPRTSIPSQPMISMAALRGAGLAATPNDGRSRVSEEIKGVQRHIAGAIHATAPDGRCERAVLITSAWPREGKSFVALNIASTFAAGGTMPAVLIDTDGKPGSITEILHLADLPGLRVLAADPTVPPAGLLVPTEITHLTILPYGAPPAEGPEVPPGPTVVAAIRRLSLALPRCAIILDAPPCLVTSDPGTLATIAGQVVMIVEAGRTQAGDVEAALDMVDACPNLQLVLNKAHPAVRGGFGAY